MTNARIPLDAFALEELRRRYLSADVSGRIALLQDDTLPFEIAPMPLTTPMLRFASGLRVTARLP